MPALDIKYFHGDSLVTRFFQHFKKSVRVRDVQDASCIARYLQHVDDESYNADKAYFEAEEPHARSRKWKDFVRAAILCQIIEDKSLNQKVDIYENGVLRAIGMKRLTPVRPNRENDEFQAAMRRLDRRARDYERHFRLRGHHRHHRSHGSGSSHHRFKHGPGHGAPLEPVQEDEEGLGSSTLYKEFRIRTRSSFYGIPRVTPSQIPDDDRQVHPGDTVRISAPLSQPTQIHRGSRSPSQGAVHDTNPSSAVSFHHGGIRTHRTDHGTESSRSSLGRGSTLGTPRASVHEARRSVASSRDEGSRAPSRTSDGDVATSLNSSREQRGRDSPPMSFHGPLASPPSSHREASTASVRVPSRVSPTRPAASSNLPKRGTSLTSSSTSVHRPVPSRAPSRRRGTGAPSSVVSNGSPSPPPIYPRSLATFYESVSESDQQGEITTRRTRGESPQPLLREVSQSPRATRQAGR